MQSYPDDIEGIMIIHGSNMQNAGKCAIRHSALIKILANHERKYGNE